MSLNLANILEYDQSLGSSLSSNLTEGENILKSRMLPFCGRIADNFRGYKLVAYCERDSDRDKRPFEVTGTISPKGKIVRMSCDCENGWTERCEHVFAALLYCNRRDLDELQVVTNEEVEAMKNADFTPKPLMDYDSFKTHLRPKTIVSVSEEQEKAIKQILYGKDFETVIIKEEPE